MTLLQIILLAVLQGLTEFLPISSSAHLILPSALLGLPDQGLAFDVAVHLGTLVAVVWYLRKEIQEIFFGWVGQCFGKPASDASKLGWMIIIATIPAGVAGLAFNNIVENHLRTIVVIAAATIFFGLLLGVADKFSSLDRTLSSLGWKSAVVIGLSQALALIPGTSRSGITMTAGLMLGLERVAAARFSFLLSVPIILLSGIYKGVELISLDSVPWLEITLGTLLSALTAYACIHLFLSWVSRIGMMPFVWYRLALGFLLIGLLVSGVV